jgi:hypothetical protein
MTVFATTYSEIFLLKLFIDKNGSSLLHRLFRKVSCLESSRMVEDTIEALLVFLFLSCSLNLKKLELSWVSSEMGLTRGRSPKVGRLHSVSELPSSVLRDSFPRIIDLSCSFERTESTQPCESF